MSLEQLLALSEHYPDLLAQLIGNLAGFVFTSMIEAYFLPQYTDPNEQRHQQGLTFLLCWFTSAGASAVLWTFFETPPHPLRMRLAVSLVIGVLSFPGYPWLMRHVLGGILARIGGSGSAWVDKP